MLIFVEPVYKEPFEVVHQFWPFEIDNRHYSKSFTTIQNGMIREGEEMVRKHLHFRSVGRVDKAQCNR